MGLEHLELLSQKKNDRYKNISFPGKPIKWRGSSRNSRLNGRCLGGLDVDGGLSDFKLSIRSLVLFTFDLVKFIDIR